jgi:uncharacterized protein (DUF1697 family)
LAGVGFDDLDSYIQSGNLVFRTKLRSRAAIEKKIADQIHQSFGMKIPVMAIKWQAYCEAIEANPFPAACAEPKSLHLFFLGASPKHPDLERLDLLKTKNESFELVGDTFYVHAPDGVGRSKLSPAIEKCLGVPTTARNWRTIMKLHEMGETRNG